MVPKDSFPEPFEPNAFVTFRLAGLQNKLNTQATRLLSRYSNITLTEWRILMLVTFWDKATMTQITKEAGLDKGQVSRAVKSLETKGYLRTRTDRGDGRARRLYVTKEGDALREVLLPPMLRRQDHLLHDVPEADRAAFLRVLSALEHGARAEDF